MISICIATYNGANFIIDQLNSVIPQLNKNDEIIIVDDCSGDDTVKIIKEIYGEKVQLYINDKNMGTIKSFEKAISKANGDIIFLCDQDDIWQSDKVKKVLENFNSPETWLVVHDAYVLDGNLKKIEESWNIYNGNKKQGIIGNIIKNSFTGACMAFKKELLNEILPFPEEIEMHDQWIGLVCLLYKKNISYIDEPLMNYIRHGENVTGIKKRSKLTILKGRLNTIKAVINYNLLDKMK
ncbi:MAG: glycosyltransferase family 2 protein [Oscillospiraceae bacterium]|nr:glycosyltransferase family 2 protein [Oscillospiraceae bacterium]